MYFSVQCVQSSMCWLLSFKQVFFLFFQFLSSLLLSSALWSSWLKVLLWTVKKVTSNIKKAHSMYRTNLGQQEVEESPERKNTYFSRMFELVRESELVCESEMI